MIKDTNGNRLATEEDKKNGLKENSQNVLNGVEREVINTWLDDAAEHVVLNIDLSDITPAEVRSAIDKLKNNRSRGEDLISGEMLKAIGEIGLAKLTAILNSVWQSEKVPNDWKRGVIVRIPKKGNLSECSNLRGITLLSVPGKLISNIIYTRIKDWAQDSMREEEAGFRKDRCCADHI